MPPKRHIPLDPLLAWRGLSELTVRLGVSRQTIIREIKAKRLSARRLGWQYQVQEREVRRYEHGAMRRAA